MPFNKLKKLTSMFPKSTKSSNELEFSDDYVELDADVGGKNAKITIRTFILQQFEDIKQILNVLREGQTIALINIAPIKDSDRMGLKRAVDKLKKTLEANEGDIAAFGEHWLVATPAFASIYKQGAPSQNEVENEGGL